MTTTYQVPDIQGWMTSGELQWLYEQASRMRSVIEVGCWKGRSTHALLSACPGLVYAVDTWEGSKDLRHPGGPHFEALAGRLFADFLHNVGGFENLVVIQHESPMAASLCPDVDMVFIDADHTYPGVRADLAAWAPKAAKLVCGHDISCPDVRRAVTECWGSFGTLEDIWFVWLT